MTDAGVLGTLARNFALLSLLAFGGGATVLPEMHRQTVEVAGWLTDQQFADLFAIAQASPGPNILIVTLIGWQVAGLAGALVATIAICGPACMLTFVVTRLWDRFRDAPWRRIVQAGLAPVTVGIIVASAYVVVEATDHSAMAFLLTAGTAALAYWTNVNPLWALALGAVLGVAGLV
ncbi:MAG: chromate transporter [Alphaproteobacteria bacterium]|nr:chromate transporter [Alphaproteobacteria bacterium]